VEQAKQEHIAGDSDRIDSVENYHFRVVGRGQRQKVVKIKRNNPSASAQ